MKKNYKSRTLLLLLNITIVMATLIYDKYFCFSEKYKNKCFLLELKDAFIEPFFYFVISLAVVSVFLFFVQDIVFDRWIKFAIGYTIIAWLIIFSTPVSVQSFNPISIERYNVSIWMSGLFLIISLILIVIWHIKERKNLK